MSARTASLLLAFTAWTLGCNVVDPVDELGNYTDRCIVRENCADGFVCLQGHCVTSAGAECYEGIQSAPCELTAGVCANGQRACLPTGRSEATCGVASYGATYEALESTCGDGLDNDCDGLIDVRRATPLASVTDTSLYLQLYEGRVVRFGTGYLAIWVDNVYFAPTNGTPTRTSVAYRVLDAKLNPVSGFAQSAGLYPSTTYANNVQAFPYDGGAFITWTMSVPDPSNPSVQRMVRKISRIDVSSAAGGSAVGVAERELPLPQEAVFGSLRAAVANDRSSVVFTWLENAAMVGQAFALDLTPLGEKVTLSAPGPGDPEGLAYGVQDISAQGPSGYALGWGTPSWTNGGRNVVRFRTASSRLDQLGTVTGTEVAGALNDLRLLSALKPSEQPIAAWLASSSAPSATASALGTGVVVASPFSPDGTISEPVGVEGVFQLNVARDGDALQMTYAEGTGKTAHQVVRRIAADGSTTVRQLDPAALPGVVTLLPDVNPGMWTAAYVQNNRLNVGATCR